MRKLEIGFFVLAVALLGVTVYFYSIDGGGDRVFASFIAACAAFFLGYRFRLKGRVASHEGVEPVEHE